MEKYISPLKTCDSDGERGFQEKNSSMEVKLEKEATIMEIDLTLENSPEKKPLAYVSDSKNKLKKLKLRRNSGVKRKFSDKTDPKKIIKKKKEEKSETQFEENKVLSVTPSEAKLILKKDGTIPIHNSNLENTEKNNKKSFKKSKAIVNKCKYTLDILLNLDSDVLYSMDKSLKIIKNHSLLSNKYITIDVLMDLISLALEKREDDFEESSFSLIVSKCLNVAGVTPRKLKVKQNSDCGNVSSNNKSILEEAPPTSPASKEEQTEKEISTIQNLEEIKQIESGVIEKVQEKSGNNFCITNYFKKLKKNVEERDKNERFSCFSPKTDMFLAPKLGGELIGKRRTQFEEEFNSQQCEKNYLKEYVSKGGIKKFNERLKNKKKSLNQMDKEIEITYEAKTQKRVSLIRVEKPKVEGACRTKAKLFQFHDNRRPPYWGTWRRKSDAVGPRKPFGRDKALNYEIDSDDEWEEEEEPGESLHGSDDEKEPEEDYEVDNDFFVPHGYLSDDENPEKENLSPKIKLDLLEEQFTSEIKQKTRKMTPIVFGTYWAHNDQISEGNLYKDLEIEKLQYVPWIATPIEIEEEEEDKNNTNHSEESTPQIKKYKKKIFPNEEIPNLIKMIHGSPQNSDHLARKFLLYWKTEKICNGNHPGLTKICVQKKIKELAVWQASHEKGRMCWHVPKETREEFGARFENKTPEKKPRKCFIWKFVRKAEKNPSGVGNLPSASTTPSTSVVEPEVVILES